MKKLIIIIPLILLGACNQNIKNNIETTQQEIKTEKTGSYKYFDSINPKDFQILINKTGTEIIDLRTKQELKQTGIISKKIKNIDVYQQDYINKLKKIDKNKIVLLYCRTGHRSAYIKAILENMGFKKVYDLSGGIYNWINKGFKTYKY